MFDISSGTYQKFSRNIEIRSNLLSHSESYCLLENVIFSPRNPLFAFAEETVAKYCLAQVQIDMKNDNFTVWLDLELLATSLKRLPSIYYFQKKSFEYN